MRKFALLSLMLLCGLSVSPLWAIAGSASSESGQPDNGITIRGIVTDSEGEPIVAASVVESKTTNGVVTDLNGRFSIQISGGGILEISCIGFVTQEIVPGNRTNITVILEEDRNFLDESIVVGYGTVKRKDLTGSVSAITGDNIASRKTTNLSTAIQGALSGVLVTRTSSTPGSSGTVQVRGVTTIGTTTPLVIIDGVQGELDYVNANDVESITVLKDAASASIYGSKAAAGVVLVTTKRGAKNNMSIEYSGEFGWEMPTKLPEMVGVTRYLEMVNEATYNNNPAGGYYQQYSQDLVENWVKYNKTDPDNYPITNWTDLIIKKSAPKTTHTVTVSGGNDIVRSNVSFAYDSVNGLYGNNKYHRYTLRANNDFTIIKDRLFASLDINVRRAKDERPNYQPFSLTRITPPIYAAVWENGAIASGKSGQNPYGLTENGGTVTEWDTQIGGNAALEVRPVKGLSIKASVAPSFYYTKIKNFQLAAYYYSKDDPTVIEGNLEGYNSTKLKETRNDSYEVTSQVVANYQHTFGKNHNFSAMAGYENYITKAEYLTASRDYYDLTEYPYLDVGPEDYQTNSGSAEEYTSNSVFARVMYDFKEKYLIQANVRADASSRFARGYRWGVFPSVSAGWTISEEGWMKSAQSWLSFLKLRASYGLLGNERIGDDYFPYTALVYFSNALFYENGSVTSGKSSYMNELAVEDITWETTTSIDVGLDMSFFDHRLNATFDYYWKTTDNMLLNIQIPYTMGYSNPNTNAGTMKTHGFDFDIGWQDKVGEFGYSVTFNLSDFLSKVTDLNESTIISDGKIRAAGMYFDEWYGYRCEGIYQTEDEVANSATTSAAVTVGDLKYTDINEDGVINEQDRVRLGNSLPRFIFGGQIALNWRGIDLSLAFQGVGKQNAYTDRLMVEGYRDNYGLFPAIIDGKYWSSYKTAEENASAKYPRLTSSASTNNYVTSDYWLFNGAYFRLKNVTLGYTFPAKWMSKAAIKNLRIYVAANDLFCISNYPKGWDPEMGVSSYPITTSVIMGLSIKF